jgi:hypothetical protein
MSDESIDISGNGSSGLSRRNALKAGVAVGVGAAAWSGASITSLGGTPAYATTAGCTGIINVQIGSNCDNTDLTSTCTGGQFAYQHLGVTVTGFGIKNDFTNQTCCDVAATMKPALTWTQPNLQCTTHVEIWHHQPPCIAGGPAGSLLASGVVGPVVGGPGGSPPGGATIDTECFQFTRPIPPGIAFPDGSIFTNIYAKCNTVGAPSNCLQ